MGDILSNVINYGMICGSLLFFAVLFGLIVFFVIWQQRREKGFKRGVAERGWRHESFTFYRNDNNHRFSGTTPGGLSWQLELARSRSTTKHQRSHMLWKTHDIRLEGAAVLVGPWTKGRQFQLPTEGSGKFNQSLLQSFAKYAIPGITDEQLQLICAVEPVEVGDQAFRQHFLVYSTDPYQANKVVENGFDRVLTEYATGTSRARLPIVVIWPWGMHLKFDQISYNFDQLERIITTGEALANTQRVPHG